MGLLSAAQHILHHFSCPYTLEQNEAVERKHSHIVETGLSLMTKSSIPLTYWDDAFSAVVFLIKRMSTPFLKNISPWQKNFFNDQLTTQI